MTKPTEEQIKALKPGDRVLVECIIRESEGCVIDEYGDVKITVSWSDGSDNVWVNQSAIHSILPREIKVGDRVLTDDDGEWDVVAPPRVSQASAREEVALWSNADGYAYAWADELEVIA
jgi:hypothetical protein